MKTFMKYGKASIVLVSQLLMIMVNVFAVVLGALFASRNVDDDTASCVTSIENGYCGSGNSWYTDPSNPYNHGSDDRPLY